MDRKPQSLNLATLLPMLRPYVSYNPISDMLLSQKSNPVVYKPKLPQCGLASESLPDEPLEWIRGCLKHDKACHVACHSRGTSKFLPSRLIDVSPDDLPPRPRLIDTNICTVEDQRYVALSHRWIDKEIFQSLELTTTENTLSTRMNGIDVNKLSKTFRFAIDVCRWLGVRYLWIDSFCIIQDSQSDWKTESSKMAQIYRCSYCTIAINIPEKKNERLWSHCGYVGETLASGWVVDYVNAGSWKSTSSTLWTNLLRGGLLGSRGWCLQERQLSPRMFHFLEPGMIMWECCHFIAALGGPILFGPNGTHSKDTKPDNEKRIIDIERETDLELFSATMRPGGEEAALEASYRSRYRGKEREVMDAWYNLLTNYTSRSLTFESDRPIAIVGLVNQVKAMTGFTYFHGLWSEDSVRGLLWERQNSTGHNWTRIPTNGRPEPPTWSWLSISGAVNEVAGNDEDTNPPLFEDTRECRPIFDHTYEPVVKSIVFSEKSSYVTISAPVMSGQLKYSVPAAEVGTQGGTVAVTHSAERFLGQTVAWACLDIPTENYDGAVTIAILTSSYGLLLARTGNLNRYRRLGVVRELRDVNEYWWDLSNSELQDIVVV